MYDYLLMTPRQILISQPLFQHKKDNNNECSVQCLTFDDLHVRRFKGVC